LQHDYAAVNSHPHVKIRHESGTGANWVMTQMRCLSAGNRHET